MRRCWIVGALTLWVAGSGCTSTARRADGPLALNSRIWGEAPAPPQRQVSLPPERAESDVASTGPVGLSKYFPGLRRSPVDPPSVATPARPGRFSIARRPRPAQLYMTDARSGLNQGMAGASVLPVAIQVPSDRASDAAVTPARAEQVSPSTDPRAPGTEAEPEKAAPKPETAPPLIDIVGTPGAADQEDGPRPDAEAPRTEPATPVVANRMPEIPPVDPRERPRLSSPAVYGASSVAQAPTPDGQKSDDHARRAFPANPEPAATPEPPTLAGFCRKLKGTAHNHPTTILASPQSIPSPPVAPGPHAKSSAQVIETGHTCVCENCGAKIDKKPCLLKRMRKAIFPGETAVVTPSAQH